MAYYRHLLKEELARRARKNPRYSMRAFARLLEMDPADLSRTLSGVRPLNARAAKRVAGKLRLEEETAAAFLESVLEEHKEKRLARIDPAASEAPHRKAPHAIPIELFEAIGPLHHYALLELTAVDGFRSDPAWIASKLRLSLEETEAAIARLVSAGLLEWSEGRLLRTHLQITTRDKHRTSRALRAHQRQILERSLLALDTLPLEKRSHSGITMPIDPDKLPVAKKLIQEFLERLCYTLSSGRRREVFQLGVSFFPLSSEEVP